jgi:hypothetical protein
MSAKFIEPSHHLANPDDDARKLTTLRDAAFYITKLPQGRA